MRGVAAMLRLWHTVRHLRPVQVWGRARFRIARPAPDLRPAPPRRRAPGAWVAPAERPPSMDGPTALRLLNEVRDVAASGWDDPSAPKLWRYNAHYFDDMCAAGAAGRAAWHRDLASRWMRENPPGEGTGWEPYPTSLRIVNWVKWAMAGNRLPQGMEDSLAAQARWLRRRLEWHLLGNHLFVNAKALVFAGAFFEGPEAEAWLRDGSRILGEQIPEQVLPDGGQFERSPMYHALALEDMLDLANVRSAFGVRGTLDGQVRERIPAMRRWLRAMCHPDGEVSFFNDSAIGVAPSPAELESYAERLGLGAPEPPADGITLLTDSGFVRLQLGRAVVLMDVGPVGPDYLPGHAHADTLSFELSLDGRRVIVNSGTSEYGTGPERLRQRGTAAHSTVEVAGLDSSEVWGGFRVARRARPFGLRAEELPGALRVTCGHDGYRRVRRGLDHVRSVELTDSGLSVADEIGADAEMVARFHWAPGTEPPGGPVRLSVRHGSGARTAASTWHPGFGVIRSNACTSVAGAARRCEVSLEWN